MLILSRRTDESVIIEVPPSKHTRRIKITQLSVSGKQVRSGYAADEDITIQREEIQKKIDAGQSA